MRKEDNQLGRVWLLMLFTLLYCLGAYFLPGRIAGHTMKQLDLLADFRQRQESESPMDSLRRQLSKEDTLALDTISVIETTPVATIDSVSLALRDSLYQALYAVEGADSLGIRIEDYSVGHIGLKRFFAALTSAAHERPVRVAVLGDSFIEGDIFVSDLRTAWQQQYGGRGVGFVPIQSVAAQYRPTVSAKAEGWTTKSVLSDDECVFTLPGLLFEPQEEEPTLHIQLSSRYPTLKEVDQLKLIYAHNQHTMLRLLTDRLSDTLSVSLPSTEQITQYVWADTLHTADLSFQQTEGFEALGVALEDSVGVVVDNFSLRGHSGLLLERMDSAACVAFDQIRRYDLIIMQYGLNVMNDSVMNYDWYARRMVNAISHVRRCFPESDLLLLSVSDRSWQGEEGFETMPAVLAMLHAQRKIAKRLGIPFWNLFGAMGGENSMVRFVENDWASKDYTHLSFRGGKEVAKALLQALEEERKFYEEMENRME